MSKIPNVLRNFCFTLNNPTVSPQQFLIDIQGSLPISYIIFQEEQGTTRHFQGYVELGKRVVFNTVKGAIPTAHIEARRGTAQEAADYCRKDDTRVSGPWEAGTMSKQGKRSDLQDAVEALQRGGIAAVVEEQPAAYIKFGNGLQRYHVQLTKYQRREPPVVTLLFGRPDSGKSFRPWNTEPNLVSIAGGLQWFCNYSGEEAVLFDEFDGAKSSTPLKHLLQYLDRYPIMLPVKGGHVACEFKRIYITSNYHPRDWYDWVEREQQYDALKRRVSTVVWWPIGGREHRDEFTVLGPDHPTWERWWLGQRPVQPMVLGPLDDYVVQGEEKDYYNFI